MKKLLLILFIVLLLCTGVYFSGTSNNLKSAFIIGDNKMYHDSSPRDLETAFVTLSGFTINRTIENPLDTFQAYYIANVSKYAYGVQVIRFQMNIPYAPPKKTSLLYGARENLIKKILGTSTGHVLTQYGNSHIIVQNGFFNNFSLNPTVTLLWITDFGYVKIYQNVIGSKYTTNDLQNIQWDIVHNDLLSLADEYIKKYPPLSATKYAQIGPDAVRVVNKIDLTKLPQLTKK